VRHHQLREDRLRLAGCRLGCATSSPPVSDRISPDRGLRDARRRWAAVVPVASESRRFRTISTSSLGSRSTPPPDQVVTECGRRAVRNAEVSFICLALDQIGGCRLGADLFSDTHMTSQGPHLRFEQIAQRVHGRRIVAVPGEVPSSRSDLCRAERSALCLADKIEQDDHALARHTLPSRCGSMSRPASGSHRPRRRYRS